MKKIIALILGILASISMQAQIEISQYINSHDQSFNVSLIVKNDKPYRVSIACESKGGNGEIWIKPSDVGKFRDALVELKSKFEEWDNIAKRSNVNEANKDMPIKFPKVEFVWGHTTTFFANDAFKAKWILKSPVEFVLCVASVKASNNRFASETFDIRFYSIQDVQNLIDALSQDKIDTAIKTTENSNLFN
ncbi:MAG: hypothetical protein ACI4BC_02475 [Muribaculaceae bacterium]